MGLSPKDMVSYIVSKSKVSEILSGKNTLSLNIPVAVLIQPYNVKAQKFKNPRKAFIFVQTTYFTKK